MKQSILLLTLLLFHIMAGFCQPCNEPPAAINCESAPLICDLDVLNGYCTTLENVYTANGPIPLCLNGGVPDNPLWIAFYAGCPTLTFTITPTNCTANNQGNGASIGIQAAIYDYDNVNGCTDSNASPDQYIACSGSCPMEFPIHLSATNLQVGKVYYLIMDGCVGSYCDVSISVDETCEPPHIEEWALEHISGPDSVCTGSDVMYNIAAPIGAIFYYWYLDSILVQDGPLNFFDIEWTHAGTYELCVDVSNACVPESADPEPLCITVTVTDIHAIDPDPVLICANDTYSFGGEDYPPGTHEIILKTSEGCDSVVTLILNSAPVKNTDLGTFYLCESDVVMVANTPITCNDQGSQEIVLQQAAYPFCDSIFEFDVVCVTVDAYVFDPPILKEEQDTVELDGGNSLVDPSFFPTYYNWYMVDTTSWTWVGDSIFHQATEWGTYCLVVTIVSPDSMAICSDTFCVVVDSIISAIHPVAAIGQWQISPVPARDLLIIQCQGEKCPGNGVLEIWDVLGRKVKEIRIENSPARWELSVSNWSNGLYLITWYTEGQERIIISKTIVQH